jgi:hypothetical protein
MPALVAHHDLHAVLVIGEQRAVGATIADRHDLAIGNEVLDVAESFGKRGLCASREMLAQSGNGLGSTVAMAYARPLLSGPTRIEALWPPTVASVGSTVGSHGRVPEGCAMPSL